MQTKINPKVVAFKQQEIRARQQALLEEYKAKRRALQTAKIEAKLEAKANRQPQFRYSGSLLAVLA